jgi:hypothetical protein
MQTLGTEWGRKLIGEDLWHGATMRRTQDLMETGNKVVITDVRFPNEGSGIEDEGGVTLGIEADWITPQEGEHESEALIDSLIASLPASRRIANRKGLPGFTQQAIQEFQFRFLTVLQGL